jgi:hypothetical protein
VRITVILLVRGGDKIVVVLLNSLLLFQTTFLSFRITSHFYYPHANRKKYYFLLFSITIFNSFILTLLFTRSKHTLRDQFYPLPCRELGVYFFDLLIVYNSNMKSGTVRKRNIIHCSLIIVNFLLSYKKKFLLLILSQQA